MEDVSEDSEVKSEDEERLTLEVKPDLLIKEEVEETGEEDEEKEIALLNFEVIMEGDKWIIVQNERRDVKNLNKSRI